VLLAVTVVTVLGAAAVADRGVARVITSRVTERLSCDLGSSSRSTIELSGPFVLPQLLSGGLRRVDVAVRGVPVDGSTADVAVTLQGVDLGGLFTADDERTISVGSGRVTAEIGYEGLDALVSRELGGRGVKITSRGETLRVSLPGEALKESLGDLTDSLGDAIGSSGQGSSLDSIGRELLGLSGGSEQAPDTPSSFLDLLGRGILGSSEVPSLLGLLDQGLGPDRSAIAQDASGDLSDLLGRGPRSPSDVSWLLDSLGPELVDKILSGRTINVDLAVAVDGEDITIAPRSLRLDDREISLDALRDLLSSVPEAATFLDTRRISTSRLPDFIHLTSLSPTSSGLALAADIDRASLSPESAGTGSGSSCKP